MVIKYINHTEIIGIRGGEQSESFRKRKIDP